ncbi:MAG TPA: endopeptidase La, partial [Erysipelotrichaceae bacterium]|nr:endopeptidase La [Erysipelotrichaceae bacterium]HCJ36856.1 endopeptidase La [Erysipelotrichaceae bacterium]
MENALVIPVYDTIVIPNATLYFNADYYKQMTGKDPIIGDNVIFIIQKEDTPYDELTNDSFEPIGVSGSVSEVNLNGYIAIRTTDRANIKDVSITNNEISISYTDRPDEEDLSADEEKSTLEETKTALLGALKYMSMGNMYRTWVVRLRSLEEVIATGASWMTITPEDKYSFIATDSKKERLELYKKVIMENIEIYRVTSEAETAQEEDNQKAYREQALKKQIEFLQKELDAMHPENVSEIRKFEIKINKASMNEEAEKEARKTLNRMKQEGENSPEYGQLYNYLDFMTQVPWKKSRFKKIDLNKAQEILDEDHYGLAKVKERILQQIAVMNLNKKQSGSILLFVGAPGTGKTSIGQSIARALGRKYERVALGGSKDEADIRGHRRTYIGAMPGRIMDAIAKAGTSNPVMVLDEVDKLGISYNGDPASALLEVLDPEQNSTFTDHYMNVSYDLSDVFFICTANSTDTIPAPLLNRMEVIQFNGYSPLEKQQIAKRHLLPKAMKTMGIKPEELELDDDVLATIVNDYTLEAGVRGLKKRMDAICRKAAVELVKGEEKITVTKDMLRKYLDMHPITHERVSEMKQPGVVTGLAWTQVGGEILFIETMQTKGSGKLILTGQLEDVMKESAEIALTLVKHYFPEKADFFENNDIHIHVPEGAIKKDGPSA